MSVLNAFLHNDRPNSASSRFNGIVIGLVTNNEDPEGLGRVKVRFPWLSDELESNWARVATPMAGPECGIYFLPKVDDEVLVAFEHGDFRFPYVLGAVWNGRDLPPERGGSSEEIVYTIKTRAGHFIRLIDTESEPKIQISDNQETNSIIVDISNNKIIIAASSNIELNSSEGTIMLNANNIELNSSENTIISSSGGCNIEASADVAISGSTINLN